MDIAEIRKKAKAQGTPGAKTAASAELPQAELQESPASQPPVSDDLEFEDALVAIVDEPFVNNEATDALDRLFAVTEEFVLATDESYAGSLENQADGQAQSMRQYLAFHLEDEEYALDITRISEIIKVREFTDIPRAPGFILGIISLRGVVVPIFDLRQRLNLGVSEILPTSRIIVSQQDDVNVGLLVDSINQVVTLSDDELEPPPGVLSGLDRDMVDGLGHYQGRMIILLNLKNVLHTELH
jgi:purine-binding chemotaxis protein CheW